MALFTTTPASEITPMPVIMTPNGFCVISKFANTPISDKITEVMIMNVAFMESNCATMIKATNSTAITNDFAMKTCDSSISSFSPV